MSDDFTDQDMRDLETRRELHEGAESREPPLYPQYQCELCKSAVDEIGYCSFCGHVTPRKRL